MNPLDKFRMDGKVALLTGAGRGIGLGMAQGLASVGCAVAIQGLDESVARDAAQQIQSTYEVKTLALGGDIGDLSLPAKLVAQTHEKLGGLHVLINNAAIQSQQSWMDLTPQ